MQIDLEDLRRRAEAWAGPSSYFVLADFLDALEQDLRNEADHANANAMPDVDKIADHSLIALGPDKKIQAVKYVRDNGGTYTEDHPDPVLRGKQKIELLEAKQAVERALVRYYEDKMARLHQNFNAENQDLHGKLNAAREYVERHTDIPKSITPTRNADNGGTWGNTPRLTPLLPPRDSYASDRTYNDTDR